VIEIAGQTAKQVRHLGEIAMKKSEAAGAKIGAGMKKAISFAGTQVGKISKTKVFSKKLESDNREEKPEPEKEVEHGIPVEQSYVEVPILDTQEPDQGSPNVDDTSSKSAPSAKNQVSHEIAIECLTCENLIHCDFRSNPSAVSQGQIKNSASCRFATQLKQE